MQIYLVAVGTKMPSYINEAVAEYQKRMPNLCPLEVIEVAALKRGKNADIPRILRDESIAIKQTIRQHVGERAKVVALDRRGQSIDTLELARQQQRWIDESQSVAIVIGGPEGLAADFIHDADAGGLCPS